MLRRTLLASAGVMALAGAAFAADLPYKAPPPVYQPPPPPLWTGFYAGLNAGYTFGGSNNVNALTSVVNPGVGAFNNTFGAAAAASATGVLPLRNEGFIGGGQIGYNFQIANAWVVGFEADIQGTGARDSARITQVAPRAGAIDPVRSDVFVANAIDYLGTVRGRIGFLWGPNLLIYGDGGFAYGGVRQDASVFSQTTVSLFPAGPAFGSLSTTRTGWTAGGGLEWMVAPNWSVKAEYLYYDLGTTTFGLGPLTRLNVATSFVDQPSMRTRWNGHVARAGINYHFNWGYPAPVVAKY